MLDYKIISSGSKGNAVRIEDVMIDCGIPFKRMKDELYKCKYLFITHRHSDHISKSTFKKIKEMFPHIMILSNSDVGYSYDLDIVANEGHEIETDDYIISPFLCPHSKDAPCTGYVWEVNGQRVIYATDTRTLKYAPDGEYDYLFLESNYDEKKLELIKKSAKKQGYNTLEGALRHLSTQECKKFYYLNRRSKDSVLVELHKSSRFY